MHERIPSNILVDVRDLTALKECGVKYIQKRDAASGKQTPPGLNITFGRTAPIGTVTTPIGTFMLCEEGIISGNPISQSCKFEVQLFEEYTNSDGAGNFSIFPFVTANLDDDDLKDLPVVKQVKLEDFIRSFGLRLETNYEICRQLLTSAMKSKAMAIS